MGALSWNGRPQVTMMILQGERSIYTSLHEYLRLYSTIVYSLKSVVKMLTQSYSYLTSIQP